jgi:hypothetical protein
VKYVNYRPQTVGMIVVSYLKIDLLISDMYFYNILVWLSILINVFIILVIWITKFTFYESASNHRKKR